MTCPKCNGTGTLPEEESSFHKEGELPDESKKCDRCEGTCEVPPRFFLEFVFESPTSSSGARRYWLPLSIDTEDKKAAERVSKAIETALGEQHFKVIDRPTPVPEAEFSEPYIQSRYEVHRGHRLSWLNMQIWAIEGMEPEPTWDFDKHAEYAAMEGLTDGNPVARTVARGRLPVKVIKENERIPKDLEKVIVVNIVQQKD